MELYLDPIDKTQIYYDDYIANRLLEREIGFLGFECRFICKLINTFQTESYGAILIRNQMYKYIHSIINMTDKDVSKY